MVLVLLIVLVVLVLLRIILLVILILLILVLIVIHKNTSQLNWRSYRIHSVPQSLGFILSFKNDGGYKSGDDRCSDSSCAGL